MSSAEFSVVIPLYNEAGLLKKAIPDFMAAAGRQTEVLIVENGSTDGSVMRLDELAKAHANLRVLRLPYPSFGAAVRSGLLAASCQRVVLLNADWLEAGFVERALVELDRADIVVGSKALADSHDQRPLFRKLTSHLLTRVVKLFYGYRGGDTHGLKAFKMGRARPIIERCRSNELIESELLIRAQRAGLRISELPTTIDEIRPPRIGLSRRMWRMARELLALKRLLRVDGPYPLLHADDAGYDKPSVDVLMDLSRAGRLAGISVLANGRAVDYFANQYQKLPSASRPPLWLHFNLVEGQSLSEAFGRFSGKGWLIKQALLGQLDEVAVREELAAQLAKLQALDLPISGIDSHQHMHALEPLASTVAVLAKQHHFEVRSYGSFQVRRPLGWLKRLLFRWLACLSNFGYRRRFGLPPSWRRTTGRPFVVASWEKINIARLPVDTIIVCHPALDYDKTAVQ